MEFYIPVWLLTHAAVAIVTVVVGIVIGWYWMARSLFG